MPSNRKEAAIGTSWRLITALFLVLLLFRGMKINALAAPVYTNPDTGYVVTLEDDAELMTEEERAALTERMKAITKWGNVGFKSISENPGTTERYIEDYYRDMFGTSSGTVFLIDMDNRNIWIKNNGAISKVITNAYSDTITDNSYRYASDKDYYGCANEVFSEIATVLSGHRIAQPMKYISNALCAVILAFLINYVVMRCMAGAGKPGEKELLKNMKHHCQLTNARADLVKQTKRYSPPSSDSDGGSGGGGGGGGGSSGSGGGHSF